MRRRDCLRAARVVAMALAAVLAGTGAGTGAQPEPAKRTRGVFVKPDHEFGGVGGVELNMRIETAGGRERTTVRPGDEVEVGQRVVICFTSSASGWVTVWSRDAAGSVPVRIYPNEYAEATAGEAAARVEAGAETCLGEGGGFRLEVGPPAGEAEVYLHYTREASEQFDETDFPQIRATRGPDDRQYASSSLQYRVVQ